jgi:hypothetical protein
MDRRYYQSQWPWSHGRLSEVEDVPAHVSKKWMNDILRGEIGFRGVVESEGDGFATLQYEHIVPTQKEAGLLGLKAGVDLNITWLRHEYVDMPRYICVPFASMAATRTSIWSRTPVDCRSA